METACSFSDTVLRSRLAFGLWSGSPRISFQYSSRTSTSISILPASGGGHRHASCNRKSNNVLGLPIRIVGFKSAPRKCLESASFVIQRFALTWETSRDRCARRSAYFIALAFDIHDSVSHGFGGEKVYLFPARTLRRAYRMDFRATADQLSGLSLGHKTIVSKSASTRTLRLTRGCFTDQSRDPSFPPRKATSHRR
jgi:hypothetical protein